MSAADFSMTHKLAAAEGATITLHFLPAEGVRLKAAGVPLLVAGLLAGVGPLGRDKAMALASDLGTLAGMLEAFAEVVR